MTRTNTTHPDPIRDDLAATAKQALNAWAENRGKYGDWMRASADLREYDAMHPDPYELTNPKSDGWAERVEDEMEQRE